MNKTKTGIRQTIALPPELVAILKWHIENLPKGKMRESELLFPSTKGGFRSSTALDKPFEEVSKAIKLPFRFTPKGMRRTFQDLARMAQVKDLVTRSISGHLTEEMQNHYSTVTPSEMRESIGKIVSLADFKAAMATKSNRETDAAEGGKLGGKRPRTKKAG